MHDGDGKTDRRRISFREVHCEDLQNSLYELKQKIWWDEILSENYSQATFLEFFFNESFLAYPFKFFAFGKEEKMDKKLPH